MTSLILTDHAVARFQERVRPGLSLKAARTELLRLICECGAFGNRPDWKATEHVDSDGWLLLGDDVALSIKRGKAITCVTRNQDPVAVEQRRKDRRWRRRFTRARANPTPRSAQRRELKADGRRRKHGEWAA